MATDDLMIAALLRERAGYEQAGRADRVAAVDKQLALRGYEHPEAGGPAEPSPAAPTDKQRTTPPKARRAPRKARTS